MNMYIDFDRTLYDTDKLYMDMFKIINSYGITEKMFEDYKNEFFRKPILFNYIKLIKYICRKENIDYNIILELLNLVQNGEKYLYSDSYDFIKKMKRDNYNVSLLTYGDSNFQMLKVTPLKICDIIDTIIISSDYKFNLNLDYENSLFIDDNPRDLLGFANKGALKIIRIKRENTKYCNEKLTNSSIASFKSLSDIVI